MDNTIVRIIQYIKHLQQPLVWRFGNCSITLSRYSFDRLSVTSDSPNEDCQEKVFSEDTDIHEFAHFLAQCTVTGQYEDGTYISEIDEILERLQYILEAPVDIDKVAGWLIEQYENGNHEPLVSRVQVILSNMDDTTMTFYEEDKQVCEYYQQRISQELFDDAFNAMTNARINIVKLSTLRPKHKPKGN